MLKQANKRHKAYTKEMIWLIVLISSYFFCLPLGRYSVGPWASDFRIFDFAILLFFTVNYSYLSKRFTFLFSHRGLFLRYVMIMLLLVYVSLFFAIAYSGLKYILPTMIRLFRFTGYILTGLAVIATVNNHNKYKIIFYTIFINMSIQAILAFMQGIGMLPQFWPQYWLDMYDNQLAPVATLSPHHKHIGVVMLVGISLALALFRLNNNWLTKLMYLLIMLTMFAVPLFAGTRTYLLGLAGFIPAYFYINKIGAVPSMAAILLLVFMILRSSFSERITEPIVNKYQERVTGRIEKFEGYEGLYIDRAKIYLSILNTFKNKPYILLTGTGFQNSRFFIRGTGAHNNYLHVLLELGIAGFIVFMLFLYYVHKNLLTVARFAPLAFERITAAHIWISFVAVLLTMLVGETFWAQAAMFTLAGQLMALWALGVTPVFWLGVYRKLNKQSGAHYSWY